MELAQKKNQLLKTLYYSFYSYSLTEIPPLKLGYVFHTERILEENNFSRLLRFCRSYTVLTGKKAICTLMPYSNARVLAECQKNKVGEEEYLERTRLLAGVADLGYHGHFWVHPDRLFDEDSEMKKETFLLSAFREQLERDLLWFQENKISHNGAYAAGWWFMNRRVLESLLENNFQLDFSFSHSKWFHNPYSEKWMRTNHVLAGEPFQVSYKNKKLVCIQNLIGCHQTPFPEDFVRNLLKLDLSDNQKELVGVVNSHDYDLDEVNTLKCIEYLQEKGGVQFLDLPEFSRLPASVIAHSLALEAGE